MKKNILLNNDLYVNNKIEHFINDNGERLAKGEIRKLQNILSHNNTSLDGQMCVVLKSNAETKNCAI